MIIDAKNLHFKDLNDKIRNSNEKIVINNCLGQRFIASGMNKEKTIEINGIPGNALGAYLDGAEIKVFGNGQDAVGDTMNDGKIIIKGNVGDTLGYGMRGGKIYILGNSGYRTGIHMKEYGEKKPVIIIGGESGSFLGEYMAGGLIIVLGLYDNKQLVYNFTGTGMHGGKIFLRTTEVPVSLPAQVTVSKAEKKDLEEIADYLKEYSIQFSLDYDKLINSDYLVLRPNAKNPYKRLYTVN
jgi:glutamate synthase domain-containing protein 3